ncbi:hypothetical protein GCM10027295_15750 [Pseudaeromonas pectinilytica]
MPRRSILSAAERESLLALPDIKDDLIRHYTFSDSDLLWDANKDSSVQIKSHSLK